jgi:hypothetical protein
MSTRIKCTSAVLALCLVVPASALGSYGYQPSGGSGGSDQPSGFSSVSALTGADVPAAVRSADDSTFSSVSALTGAPDPVPTQAPASSVSADDRSGFDWGDAGIGAAISLAAMVLLAGLYTQLRHRRSPVPVSPSHS